MSDLSRRDLAASLFARACNPYDDAANIAGTASACLNAAQIFCAVTEELDRTAPKPDKPETELTPEAIQVLDEQLSVDCPDYSSAICGMFDLIRVQTAQLADLRKPGPRIKEGGVECWASVYETGHATFWHSKAAAENDVDTEKPYSKGYVTRLVEVVEDSAGGEHEGA